ncbi:hypothetical protein LCGC14_0879420 [marine sediment metagenome]|uniref:Uncharacterized protein n=1 Tax=marine sediment metagenome TaxID=412755 RepID=A0A0F9S9D2_9ZZZZ
MANASTKKSKSSSPQSTSVLERIRKPSGELKRLAACIYGRPGVGKTTLLGTMPGKGLVIDIPQVEGGTAVLADKADRIDVAPVVRWEEVDELYQALRTKKLDYSWVAIDTISALQQLAKRKAMKESDHVKSDPNLVTQGDWGKVGQLMTSMVFQFRLLRMHTIFLAQEKPRTTEDGFREFQPSVSPMTMDALPGAMHLVARLYLWENESGVWERRLRVGPHQNFMTKTRAVPGRELPTVLLNPNLAKIFTYLMGHKDAKKPRAAKDESSSLLELEAE